MGMGFTLPGMLTIEYDLRHFCFFHSSWEDYKFVKRDLKFSQRTKKSLASNSLAT